MLDDQIATQISRLDDAQMHPVPALSGFPAELYVNGS